MLRIWVNEAVEEQRMSCLQGTRVRCIWTAP